jgi:hypothetical protein
MSRADIQSGTVTPTSVATRVGVFAAGAALSALLTYAAASTPSTDFTPLLLKRTDGMVFSGAAPADGTYTFDSTANTISRELQIEFLAALGNGIGFYKSTTTLNLATGDFTSSMFDLKYASNRAFEQSTHKLSTENPDDTAILADLIAGACRNPLTDRDAMFDALEKTKFYKEYLAQPITAGEANCSTLETALFFLSAKVYPYQRVDADLHLPNAPASIINKAHQSSATPRAALTLASLLAASALAAALV